MTETTSNDVTAAETPIYRHRQRPEWGCAILVWDRGDKRAYQFEDGKQRVFARRFCDMFAPVDRPVDETDAIKRNLLQRAGHSAARIASAGSKAIPLALQVELFLDTYAKGFRDPDWATAHRSTEGKRLKRHRDGLIAEARAALGRTTLDAALAAQRYDDVIAAMRALAAGTDLVSKAQAAPLDAVHGEAAAELAVALRELLFGDGEHPIRFERFVLELGRAMGKAPSWQLATLYAAAVHPEEHLFVRPRITDLQAEWMAPGIAMTAQPNAQTYARLRTMAMTLGEKLGQSGLAPRDLLDLHDFMWETLRPKALELLTARSRRTQLAS